MSAASIAARNWVELTNVVLRGHPFQRTTDVEMKPRPLTVNVNPAPPATAAAGASDAISGTGLSEGSTVTTGLVADLVLFANSRNSYVPAVDGIVTVHVRLVIPAPT
jgi:hypothetical protein